MNNKYKTNIFINNKLVVNCFFETIVIKDKNGNIKKHKILFCLLETGEKIRTKENLIYRQCINCKSLTILRSSLVDIKNFLYNKEYYCINCYSSNGRSKLIGKKKKYKTLNQYTKAKLNGILLISPLKNTVKTQEIKEKISTSIKNKYIHGYKNPMTGKKQSLISRQKMSKFRIGKKLEELVGNEEAIRLKVVYSENAIKRLQNLKYKKTKIEEFVENYIKNLKIKYIYSFILDKKYQYDFLLPDYSIFIEVQGDYWHANPMIYPNKELLTERQKYKTMRDAEKLKYAAKNGYKIIYIWETDINNNNYTALNEIQINKN